MKPHYNQLHPLPAFKTRREELLACRRCGREKTRCDGQPCEDCGDEGVVCDGEDCGHPGGAVDKWYVERLEAEREVLSLGLREACRRLIVAGCWPTESLPSDGRPHDIHEMLVTLGLIPHSKEKESAGEYLERGDSAQMRRESSPATQHLSVDRTLERSSDWKPYIGRFMEHDVPHEAWPRPRNAHINVASAQPIAATPASKSNSVDASSSKKSSNIASRAIDLRPDAAPMAAQDLQTVLSHSHGQIWRHTTDAYQEVSGPSDVRKKELSSDVNSSRLSSRRNHISAWFGSFIQDVRSCFQRTR